MALPPIISNVPFLKILTGGPSRPAPGDKPAVVNAAVGDQVTLSPEALKKLDELQTQTIKTPGQARDTAGIVRADLETNPDITLGAAS